MIGMVTGTVLLCWFLNSTFLESFYTVNKENALLEGFHTIDKAVINDTFESDEFDIAFERICSNGNISILVLSPDAQVLRSSAGNSEKLKNQFYGALYESSNKHASEVIKTTDNYIIEKQQDSRLEADYLVLWGTLEDGNLVLMRTALASIKESVMIANEFLAYVAVMATVCCAILAIFVSRRITGPILQLTKISKRMAELDFDAKYKPNKRQNEVDELGEHMNMLSATLETTISELKSANNELKKDIEKKEEIDRMRKEFLSNVSHELKTPLALIQGYAEGLQECINDDEESRDFYCEVIMDEADKMNQMVKKLLTLNQLEFGNDTLVGVCDGNGVNFPPFDKLADTFGFRYFKIDSLDGIEEKLQEVLNTDGPVLCEAILDEAQNFAPKLSSKVLPDGKIVSPPIDDMFPFLDRAEYQANKLQ